MISPAQLQIRLTAGRVVPIAGNVSFDQIIGGPETLLAWLVLQLGLPQPDVHRVARVMQYADAPAKVDTPCFEKSFSADRWETTSKIDVRDVECRMFLDRLIKNND